MTTVYSIEYLKIQKFLKIIQLEQRREFFYSFGFLSKAQNEPGVSPRGEKVSQKNEPETLKKCVQKFKALSLWSLKRTALSVLLFLIS